MSLEISPLGLGCWAFGGIGAEKPDDSNSISIIQRARSLGICHLDTAQDYGNGHSEQVIGRAVRDLREAYFISTKSHLVSSIEETIELVKLSLMRMQSGWIDLFYIHWPKTGMDIRPMIEGLEKCRELGLIKKIGVSNFNIRQMESALTAGKIDVLQLGYNLLWRFPEKNILLWCRENSISTIAYSPIAQGLLSNKGTDLSRRRADDPRNQTVYYRKEVWQWLKPIVEQMQHAASTEGTDLSDAALRWVLQSELIDGTISGAGNLKQLEAHGSSLEKGALSPKLTDLFNTLSDVVMQKIPDVGNIFQYQP